jgi:hypothetical protein
VRRLTDLVDRLEKQRIIQRENTAQLRGTIASAINRRADDAVEPPHGLRQLATPTTRPGPRCGSVRARVRGVLAPTEERLSVLEDIARCHGDVPRDYGVRQRGETVN